MDYTMKQPAIIGERQKIIDYLERFICFDLLEGRGCEHNGCYTLRDLQRDLDKGLHLER
jgi:hypothetical protein